MIPEITIGIIEVRRQQTILVGLHQRAANQYMTHVRQVGVFPMAEAMVYGQRPLVHLHISLTIHYTTAPIKA